MFLHDQLQYSPGANIVAFKKPSIIRDVKYKSYIEELYATPLAVDEELDQRLKKNIVNVATGLLEKSENKAGQTYMFNSLSECLYYQQILGGSIIPLNSYIVETVTEGSFPFVWVGQWIWHGT